jgi:hypothetical protein
MALPALEADAPEGFLRALPPFPRLDPGVQEGKLDVLQGAGARQEIEALEDEADAGVADLGQIVAAEAADVPALEPVGPAFGLSRQPRMLKVDLPEPDGPMTATNSPLSIAAETPRRAGTPTPSRS